MRKLQLHHLINYSYSPTTLKYVAPAQMYTVHRRFRRTGTSQQHVYQMTIARTNENSKDRVNVEIWVLHPHCSLRQLIIVLSGKGYFFGLGYMVIHLS